MFRTRNFSTFSCALTLFLAFSSSSLTLPTTVAASVLFMSRKFDFKNFLSFMFLMWIKVVLGSEGGRLIICLDPFPSTGHPWHPWHAWHALVLRIGRSNWQRRWLQRGDDELARGGCGYWANSSIGRGPRFQFVSFEGWEKPWARADIDTLISRLVLLYMLATQSMPHGL